MNNHIILNHIEITEYRITYDYTVTGYWKRYFKQNERLYVSFSESLKDVSYEGAVIPFLMAVMPVAWLMDGQVTIDRIDEITMNSLEKYRMELQHLYPKLNIHETKINGKMIEKDSDKSSNGRVAVYFSGGVDAWDTLISCMDESPILFTVLGADMDVDNEKGKAAIWNDTQAVVQQFGLHAVKIESNLRKIFDEWKLSKFILPRCTMQYWQAIAAGIGIIGLSAPITKQMSIGKIYVSTSYSDKQVREGNRDAIAGILIESLEWQGTNILTKSQQKTRQQRIESIVAFCKTRNIKIKVRACWKDSIGENCCKCEKCYRTIIGIAAAEAEPCDYGFQMNLLDYLKIPYFIKKQKENAPEHKKREISILWSDIQQNFHNKKWRFRWMKHFRF